MDMQGSELTPGNPSNPGVSQPTAPQDNRGKGFSTHRGPGSIPSGLSSVPFAAPLGGISTPRKKIVKQRIFKR